MWQWLTVTPDTFRAWYDFDSEELRAAEAGALPSPQIVLACQERGAPVDELAALLAEVVSIVYDSLFGPLDLELSLARLRNIEAVAARSGIALPAPQRFSGLRAQDMHGWGFPVTDMQVTAWRSES